MDTRYAPQFGGNAHASIYLDTQAGSGEPPFHVLTRDVDGTYETHYASSSSRARSLALAWGNWIVTRLQHEASETRIDYALEKH